MSRPTRGNALAAGTTLTAGAMEQVSGREVSGNTVAAMVGSAAIFKQGERRSPQTDRKSIAQPWQYEAYRQVSICGEARYAIMLFSAVAGRAEIGVSEPNTQARRATWVKTGPEVDALAEIAPTVRERTALIRSFMTHWNIAGECYLIARRRVDTDTGYIPPPDGFEGTWDEYLAKFHVPVDLYSGESAGGLTDPNEPVWEIVAVTEMQRVGKLWRVRHDNYNYLDLDADDPVIRMWNPDPANRREAWSPIKAMLTTLQEIEWLTRHIFAQVKSRLMSAGVWFLPDNLTFPDPPPEAVEGGAEAIAAMNEAERFMVSLAASSTNMLEHDEVSFPTVVMSDAAALVNIDQQKLIKFWSEIDDKAMTMRDGAVRRFALGMDLPPEQVIGAAAAAGRSSGGGGGGSATGQMNHWGQWALDEQTITSHIEPALDAFVGVLTHAFLRVVVENTTKVIGYDTASLRLRPDRSKEATEFYDRGGLKLEVALRENGFDPETDMMDDDEFKRWLLVKMLGGSPSPEMMVEAIRLLGQVFTPAEGDSQPADGQPGQAQPPSLEDHPYEGPPREQHDHTDAPFRAVVDSAEGLVLRALEKSGNRLLNDGKRGRDKDRTTPAYMAHVVAGGQTAPEFDFTMLPVVFGHLPAVKQAALGVALTRYCTDLYDKGEPYSREGLIEALT